MKKSVKIIGLVFLIITGIVYYFINLSFTKYNIYPVKTSNEFLEKIYGKKFTLLDIIFYVDNGDYVWEMQYKDENDLMFNEYFFHPIEGSEGFFYIFFDKDYGEQGFRDYYWQAEVQNKFDEEFDIKKYQTEVGYAMPMYRFIVHDEDDIKKVANIIAVTLAYTLKNVRQLPDKAIGAYDVEYMGERICLICIDSKMKECADKDYDELFQYIYDKIYNNFHKG